MHHFRISSTHFRPAEAAAAEDDYIWSTAIIWFGGAKIFPTNKITSRGVNFAVKIHVCDRSGGILRGKQKFWGGEFFEGQLSDASQKPTRCVSTNFPKTKAAGSCQCSRKREKERQGLLQFADHDRGHYLIEPQQQKSTKSIHELHLRRSSNRITALLYIPMPVNIFSNSPASFSTT